MASVKRFFFQVGQFAVGHATSVVLGMISFPILTRVLTREQYGLLGLVSTTMAFLVACSKAGLSDGIVRFHRQYQQDVNEAITFASTALFRSILFSSVFSGLYVIVVYFYSKMRPDLTYEINIFYVMSIVLLVRPSNILIANFLRAEQRVTLFNIFAIIGRIASIALSLSMLLWIVKSYIGYFIGLALSESISLTMLLFWFLRTYRVRLSAVSADLARRLIAFGLPLLLSEICYLLLQYVDRYMIAWMRGIETLGLYTAGYNLAMYFGEMIMFSVSYAVQPVYVRMYQEQGRAETEEFLGRCCGYLVMFIIPLCAGYWAVARDLFAVVASNRYVDAAEFSPLVLLGTAIMALNSLFSAGLYIEKKPKTILGIMLSAVGVNVFLNLLLLSNYGAKGAALATLAACCVVSVGNWAYGKRTLFVRVDSRNIIYYALVSLCMLVTMKAVAFETSLGSLVGRTSIGMCVLIAGIIIKERRLIMGHWPLLSRGD